MTPLTIVCWRWEPPAGYRSTFGPETVTVLRNMVRRHYPKPHRFVCVTDAADGIDRDIEIIPPWNDYVQLRSPHGGKNPSCYRRLRLFHPEVGAVLGPRFVSLDLDCIVTGDLTPIFERQEDFVMWGDTNPKTHYNGSLLLMNAGARPQVWTRFDPDRSPAESLQAGCFGSDQGWISHCLGGDERKFSKADGVYSFRNDIRPSRSTELPADARLVIFHGEKDPWSADVQATYPFVKRFYQ